MSKTIVVYHRSDYDGIFCREIARKFLPDAELIGWDFADPPLDVPDGKIYVLDLPLDRPFGFVFGGPDMTTFRKVLEEIKQTGKLTGSAKLVYQCDSPGVVWIDHHKSSIESHPSDIPGYRIDGVAACRLAWQWFYLHVERGTRLSCMPSKEEFVERDLIEPFAVRLAGEYDIWDKRDDRAELFQMGLRSQELTAEDWAALLDEKTNIGFAPLVQKLLMQAKPLAYAKNHENESIIKELGFTLKWEGLTFLACNHARYNSFLFTAGLTPEHDACFGFKWTGKDWSVSLYHAPGKEHHDLSLIATKYGGGGHRGACGFRANGLPFLHRHEDPVAL